MSVNNKKPRAVRNLIARTPQKSYGRAKDDLFLPQPLAKHEAHAALDPRVAIARKSHDRSEQPRLVRSQRIADRLDHRRVALVAEIADVEEDGETRSLISDLQSRDGIGAGSQAVGLVGPEAGECVRGHRVVAGHDAKQDARALKQAPRGELGAIPGQRQRQCLQY